MNLRLLAVAQLALLIWSAASAAPVSAPRELALYTYDSFVAKGGLGPEIFPVFEKKCGCHLKVIAVGDAGQLLSRLQLDAERGKPGAQLVVGLDLDGYARALPWLESWGQWRPKGYSELVSEARKSGPNEAVFLPFNYGLFAFMADRQALRELGLKMPTRLSDLLGQEWKRQIILEDPRTSTPGLAFLYYTNEVLPDFWKKFRGHWLTFTSGWDQAYGLFLKKEAPLVWSYTTSQAYHEENGDDPKNRRYEAVLFEEGQPLQLEGAALVAGGTQGSPESTKLARSFLEYLISPEVQAKIPRHNWMFPVLKNVDLPASFKALRRPVKILRVQPARDAAARAKEALSRWQALVQ